MAIIIIMNKEGSWRLIVDFLRHDGERERGSNPYLYFGVLYDLSLLIASFTFSYVQAWEEK